jgi:pyruvate formate lyase activating enzyme
VSENRYLPINIDRYPYRKLVSTSFYKEYKRRIIICRVCERKCYIPPGYTGICGDYANEDGKLIDVGYGYISAVESRPIEIKPLYHFYPNSTALTFSGWGCNLHCPWCQNYHLSMSKPSGDRLGYIDPVRLVKAAVQRRDDGVCASFNEPTIHLQYLLDVFILAKREGLYTTIVSNGYMSKEACKALIDAGLDGLNIDIKGCPQSHRKELRGVNPLVMFRNAELFLKNGVHVEMVYLVVPGFNDDLDCFNWILDHHIQKLGVDVPLHINRYYPAYKYREESTSLSLLSLFYQIAKDRGLKYVYIGNIWDPKYESTYCPKCNELIIYRKGNKVRDVKLINKRCIKCGYQVFLTGDVLFYR